MEKQMKAEGEKSENNLFAEGEKQSAITLAEGEKEAAILKAEAVKEKRIREAQGEAEALLAIEKARAQSIELINNAKPSAQYLKLKQYDAAVDMANGQATKLIVPSDITNLAGTVSAIAEIAKDSKEKVVSTKKEVKPKEVKPQIPTETE
jgi:regulator of protease activity HflC (stomatin/prohibitin superfamily)